MDTNYTVADVIAAVARFNYPQSEVLRRLNRVSEFFLNSDVYTDLFSVLKVTTSNGYFSIPPEWGRAYGIIQGDSVQPIGSQWSPFTELGMARFDPSSLGLGGATDLGQKFCTQTDVYVNGVEQPGTLRIFITNPADAGKIVRFSGTSDGITRIFDAATGFEGINLTTVDSSADTTVVFQTVDGIQLSAPFLGRWVLFKVISGTPTVIGTYEPVETRPQYHRYYLNPSDGDIFLICRRKFIPYRAVTDWVRPANMMALEKGFIALTYGDRGDFKGEGEAFELAKKWLKEQYASELPYVTTMMTSDGFGANLNAWKRDGYRWGFQVGDVTVYGS